MIGSDMERRFSDLFGSLGEIGGSPVSGYDRLIFNPAELAARRWFRDQAQRLNLDVQTDGNTNMWAWWGRERSGAIGTGSHLDSVVKGGAFDGALGVVAAFVAVEHLQQTYPEPLAPIAIIAFAGEEGARFGLPTLGSRLLSGAVDPQDVLARTDSRGTTFGDAMAAAGFDPDTIGPDTGRMAQLSCYVELHVEQGRGLVDQGAAVGVISDVWPHGRYRIELTGIADHAGAATMDGRADPMLVLAEWIRAAEEAGGDRVRTTVGRVVVAPNSTNTIASGVSAWLDARGAVAEEVDAAVAAIREIAANRAADRNVGMGFQEESWSPAVVFDSGLSERTQSVLARLGHESLPLATAAGHDAAVLGLQIPSAMLHVRNPTGVSHAPQEHASREDCVAGVEALAAVLEELACR